MPDYLGNNLFNTLGNLLVNPVAGILLVDFEAGDQLHLHARAELIDADPADERFPGAQRLLNLNTQSVQRSPAATPLRWR